MPTHEVTGAPTSEQQAELERFGRDIDYFNDHYDELLAQHPDEWVAVFNETVAASSPDFLVLLDELQRRGVPAGRAFVEYVSANQDTLIVVAQ